MRQILHLTSKALRTIARWLDAGHRKLHDRYMHKRFGDDWPENCDEKVTETNEFEVHDLFCSLYHLQLKNNVENEPTERVEIVVKGYDDENGEHIAGSLEDAKAVEDAVNALLDHMREVDCIIHDHFEYTC